MGTVLSRVELEAFPSLSFRARVAYALGCIEKTAEKLALHGAPFEEWRERAWRRTSSPKEEWRASGWPRNFAEIDALFDPPPGGWEGIGESLRKVFEHAKETCESILEKPAQAAGCESLRALVVEVTRNGVHPPDPGPYAEWSPFGEMGGWGRSVPPGFFREGWTRESFPSLLATRLTSPLPTSRREAAHCAGHLGMGSESLENALATALFDGDPEVARLAEAALLRMGRADLAEVLELAREQRALAERVLAGRAADDEWVLRELANPDPDARLRAVRHAERSRDARVVEGLRRARYDDTTEIRRRAATSLAEILVELEGRDAVLRDPDEEVRIAAALRVQRRETTAEIFRMLTEIAMEPSSIVAQMFLAELSSRRHASAKADLVKLALQSDAALAAFLRVVCLERDERFFTRAISHAMDGTKDPDAEGLRRAGECLQVLERHRPK